MVNRSVLAGVFCATLLLAPAAFADGVNDPRRAQSSLTIVKKEKGVSVYRGPSSLLGDASPTLKPEIAAEVVTKKVIVEHHYHSRIAHLRTQGFYSGHPGCSRRFTQGFYSGPVDKGRAASNCRRG